MLALALAGPVTPMVRGPSLAPPSDGLYALAPLVLVLLVLSVLYAARARRERAHSRRRGGVMASFALGVALRCVLVDLGAMLDPSRPVVMIMERGDCERAPDDLGDGRDPEGSPAGPPDRVAGPRPAARC